MGPPRQYIYPGTYRVPVGPIFFIKPQICLPPQRVEPCRPPTPLQIHPSIVNCSQSATSPPSSHSLCCSLFTSDSLFCLLDYLEIHHAASQSFPRFFFSCVFHETTPFHLEKKPHFQPFLDPELWILSTRAVNFKFRVFSELRLAGFHLLMCLKEMQQCIVH